MTIPEHIKQKIKEHAIQTGWSIRDMEYGYSLAQEEIERLKAIVPENAPATWMSILKNKYEEIERLIDENARLKKEIETLENKIFTLSTML